MSRSGGGPAIPPRAVDAALLVLVGVLTVITVVVIAVPAIMPAMVDVRLDVAIVTAAALVTGAVAAIEWARGRLEPDGAALLRGAAFAVLAALNGLTLAVQLLDADAAVGASLANPGQLPLVAAIVGRTACALLLIAAGIPAIEAAARRTAPGRLLVTPPLVVAALLGAAFVAQDRLPELAGQAALEQLAAEPTAILAIGSAPSLAALQSLVGVAFLLAAWLARRAYRSSGRIGDALMSGALVMAAFSQAHSALHPGSYTMVVTTGDLLRLGFYAMLLAGIVVDRRDDLRALRAANVEVRRLAEAEVAAAALAERARLAREIHDGLAQDLWYAKLKQTRLAQLAGFDGEARQLSDEVESALDAALAEARQAVAAMRDSSRGDPLVEVLERQVEDFSDRFALRAELEVTGPPLELGPRVEAELLRIVQEALTNARRHADATLVRVSVSNGDHIRIAVADNGRGFRESATSGGFGLESMRQRAELIGATLRVISEPQNGTRVEIAVPPAHRRDTNGR